MRGIIRVVENGAIDFTVGYIRDAFAIAVVHTIAVANRVLGPYPSVNA